jgi:hypothetical protein
MFGNINNQNLKNNIDASLFGVAFLCLFSIDPILYFISSIYQYPKFPLGVIAGVLLFFMSIRLGIRSPKLLIFLPVFIVIFAFMGISAINSQNYTNEWVWLGAWYFAMTILGAGMVIYEVCSVRWFQIAVLCFTTLGLVVVITSLWDGFDNRYILMNYLRVSNGILISGVMSIYVARSTILRILIMIFVGLSLAFLTSRFFFYGWMVVPALFLTVYLIRRSETVPRRILALASGFVVVVLSVSVAYFGIAPVAAKIANPRIAPNIEITRALATNEHVANDAAATEVDKVENGDLSDGQKRKYAERSEVVNAERSEVVNAERSEVVNGDSSVEDVDQGALTVTSTDTSFSARITGIFSGVEDIKESPIFGVYDGHRQTGYGYIHNGLSYWQQFGIVPFVLITALLIGLPSLILLRGAPAGNLSPLFVYVFILIGGFVLARAYPATELWMGIGIMLAVVGGRSVIDKDVSGKNA